MMKLPGIKRILPLILTVLLLPTLLAVPARADEVDPLVNVLDYSTLDNCGDNYKYLNAGNNYFSYALPSSGVLHYIDMVVYSSETINSVSACRINTSNDTSWIPLELISLGDGLYRIYGDGYNYRWDNVWFKFDVSANSYLNVLKFEVSYAPILTFGINAAGYVYDYSYSPLESHFFSYSTNGDAYFARWTKDQVVQNGWRAELPLIDWKGYDYIDIYFSTYSAGVVSLLAHCNLVNVPFEINYIDSGEYTLDLTVGCVTLDLTGLDRNLEYDVVLEITGNSIATVENNFGLQGIYGYVVAEEPSVFAYWFSFLNTWISDQTNAISSTIAVWGQNIVDALGGSNDSSGVQDNINAAVGELDQVQGVLDGVARPDLDAIDFDVSGLVDVSAAATYGNIFSTLLGNQYMTNILMIAFILAAASFLLFGRR